MSMAFRPLAGSNAIESCSLAIRFPSPIGEDAFKAVSAAAQALATVNNLPGRAHLEPPAFLAGLVGAGQFPLGVQFQRYAANGTIEVELKCEMQLLTFTVRTYSSWLKFYKAVENLVLPLLPIYMSAIPAITSVMLQYEDVFLANEEQPQHIAGELFKPDTTWVTLHDPTTDQPWHSHFGIFVPKTQSNRTLVNVNVTVNDQVRPPSDSNQRVASITILTGDMYDVAGEVPLVIGPGDEAAVVSGIIQSLHEMQRSILGEVLNDAYLNAIGC